MKVVQINILSLFLLLPLLTDGYKLLVVFTFPGRSHNILGEGVVRNLLEAGHEVTYVTPFPKEKVPPNLKQVNISSAEHILSAGKITLKMILDKEVRMGNPTKYMKIMNNLNNITITDENFIKLLEDHSQKFDAIIAEWMFHEVITGLSAYYDCPFIWVTSLEPDWGILSLIDQLPNPAYVPSLTSTELPPFSFKQRVIELLMQVVTYSYKEWYFIREDIKLYEYIFTPLFKKKGIALPTYLDVKYNISLVLGNSHVSLGQAISLPQSYKPIGGYHIDPNVKPLSGDLKKIMNNAKDGVIYFSLGSNVKSKDFPEKLRRDILQIFGNLKQTVLWKFEDDTLKDVPKNVHILNWAPQTSILSHPNCKLFITHGGTLSTIEAVHFGKPIIGIPVFGDQFNNVNRAVKRGFAIMVTISHEMADELKTAIDEALSNPKYAAKVKELSQIYHDRLVPPARELVHWVEHVVRTRGAAHLRSPALMVPWYQKMYLDFFALMLIIIIIIYCSVRKVFKYCCGNKSKKNTKSDKKKD